MSYGQPTHGRRQLTGGGANGTEAREPFDWMCYSCDNSDVRVIRLNERDERYYCEVCLVDAILDGEVVIGQPCVDCRGSGAEVCDGCAGCNNCDSRGTDYCSSCHTCCSNCESSYIDWCDNCHECYPVCSGCGDEAELYCNSCSMDCPDCGTRRLCPDCDEEALALLKEVAVAQPFSEDGHTFEVDGITINFTI